MPVIDLIMKEAIITEFPQFITMTVLEWKPLLESDAYKSIVVSSLRYLVRADRVIVFAFVIMNNHLHLVWQLKAGQDPAAVQRDFLKYTAQRIQKNLFQNAPGILKQYRVNARDREYQFWQRRSLSIELRTHAVFLQKLEYIHWNPVKAGYCRLPEEYLFSSASFYETGKTCWEFLTHYAD